MNKVVFLLVISLFLYSCSASTPKVDSQLQQKVENETIEINLILEEITKTETNITYPADFPLRDLIPKSWLFELAPTTDKKVQVNLAIPIPQEIVRDMVTKKTDENFIYVDRGGRLDPDTDTYLVSSYPKPTTLPLNKAPENWYDYPKAISADYLKGNKIVQSPYFVPSEATHGVYRMSGPDYRKSRSEYNISQYLTNLTDYNPYNRKNNNEITNSKKLLNTVVNFKEQISNLKKDIGTADSFILAIERRYSKPYADSWNVQDELKKFRILVDTNISKCSLIETNLEKINKWDFINIEKSLSPEIK